MKPGTILGLQLAVFVFAVGVWTDSSLGGVTVGTAFTYQAQLKDDGIPLNGRYDLHFTLWTKVFGGNMVGSAVESLNHLMNNGLFAVELDFGQSAFDGSPRWLQISIREASAPMLYQKLEPRQPLSPTPYAIYAISAGHANTATHATSATQADSAASLDLPFIGSTNSSNIALSIANTGSGQAAAFGTTGTTSDATTVSAHQGGLGVAGHFMITNVENDKDALVGITLGEGDGVSGISWGSGRAGYFEINNTGSGRPALEASANGWGYAIEGTAPHGGVLGETTEDPSNQTPGAGVTGWASSETGKTIGVKGVVSSPDGVGVIGVSDGRERSGELGGPDFGVRADGDLVVTNGAFRGRLGSAGDGAPFPRPAYDSGWQSINAGETLHLDHDVGGSRDDLVVDVLAKAAPGTVYESIGNRGIGLAYDSSGTRGYFWHSLTGSSIEVFRGYDDSSIDQIRVRIWRIR